jgi:hypothetical protein
MGGEDGLLSRWSRRKAQARSGRAPAEPPAGAAVVAQWPVAPPSHPDPVALPAAAAVIDSTPPPPAPPMPTLADAAKLTPDSDFSRYVMPGVDEDVKRAAMKKLFSDPHFNVMDGLDTYIDDYGQPDPIPDAMLRRMTQSKLMRLFDEDPPSPGARAMAVPASPDGAAVTPPLPSPAVEPDAAASEPELHIDEDTALRLQPDDAAGSAGAGPHRPGARP